MKTRQFITLLAVNIIGFGILIALAEGTNSFMPHINRNIENIYQIISE